MLDLDLIEMDKAQGRGGAERATTRDLVATKMGVEGFEKEYRNLCPLENVALSFRHMGSFLRSTNLPGSLTTELGHPRP